MGNLCSKKSENEVNEETFYPKADEKNVENTATFEDEFELENTVEQADRRSDSGDESSVTHNSEGVEPNEDPQNTSHQGATSLDEHFASLGDTNGVPDEDTSRDGEDNSEHGQRLSSFSRIKGSLRRGDGEKAAKLRSEVEEDTRRAQETQEELARRRDAFLAQQRQEEEARIAAHGGAGVDDDDEEADGEGFKGFEDDARADELARAQEKLEAAKQKALQRASKYDKMVPVTNAEQKAKVIDEEEQFDYVPEGEVSDLMSMFMETETKALEEKKAEAERLKPKHKRWEPKPAPVEEPPAPPSAASLAVPDNLAPDTDDEENTPGDENEHGNGDVDAAVGGDTEDAGDDTAKTASDADAADTNEGKIAEDANAREGTLEGNVAADGSEFVGADFYTQEHNDSDEETGDEEVAAIQTPDNGAHAGEEVEENATESTGPTQDSGDMPVWLHGGEVSATDADALLAADGGCDESGRFLLRIADSAVDKYYIDVVYKGIPTHHILQRNDDGVFEVNRSPLDSNLQSVEEVVEYLRTERDQWPVALTTHVARAE